MPTLFTLLLGERTPSSYIALNQIVSEYMNRVGKKQKINLSTIVFSQFPADVENGISCYRTYTCFPTLFSEQSSVGNCELHVGKFKPLGLKCGAWGQINFWPQSKLGFSINTAPRGQHVNTERIIWTLTRQRHFLTTVSKAHIRLVDRAKRASCRLISTVRKIVFCLFKMCFWPYVSTDCLETGYRGNLFKGKSTYV